MRLQLSLCALVALWSWDAMAGEPVDDGASCTATAISRVITNFVAFGSVDHVVLTWHAQSFDTGTRFELWRSTDGGVTYPDCATDQSGQCVAAIYTTPASYALVDYGVDYNFRYSYRIWDSEGGVYWYLASAFQGSLAKPAAPTPVEVPSFTLSNLWTNGTVAKVVMALTLSGDPPHATNWAHSYTMSYYNDTDPTVRTLSLTPHGAVIVLGEAPLPTLLTLRSYHFKIRGDGMTGNTSYCDERHVRITPAPVLDHAEVVAGTSISLQWSNVDVSARYDVLYQRVLPQPPGVQGVIDCGTQRVWSIAGLEESSYYDVRVRARDSWGNPSPESPSRVLATGAASPTDAAALPRSIGLRIYPVPFPPGGGPSQFEFALPQTTQAELVIYDARGQLVRKLFYGRSIAGTHTTPWDGRDGNGRAVPSGIYVVRLIAGGKALTQKITLVR